MKLIIQLQSSHEHVRCFLIVSIHQPNYLPWSGFFHKIALSDIYVVFDDVQLVRGKSFVIRTKIKTEKGTKWLTVPVKNKSSMLQIAEVKINNELNWKEKHWNSVRHNYAKTLFFSHYQKLFQDILSQKWDNLAEMNISVIKLILKILKIDTKIVRSSNLGIKGSGTDKILDIIESVNANEYLTGEGEGSKKFVLNKEELFSDRGIKLKYQKFKHPVYSQLYGEFVPNLSICDMLFNIGAEKTLQTLNLSDQKSK